MAAHIRMAVDAMSVDPMMVLRSDCTARMFFLSLSCHASTCSKVRLGWWWEKHNDLRKLPKFRFLSEFGA